MRFAKRFTCITLAAATATALVYWSAVNLSHCDCTTTDKYLPLVVGVPLCVIFAGIITLGVVGQRRDA